MRSINWALPLGLLGVLWTGSVALADGTCTEAAGCGSGIFGGGGGGGGTVTSVEATQGAETTTGLPINSTGTIRGSILVNAQTDVTYTMLTGDRGKLVTFSNASPVAVTQPVASASFPSGWYVDVQNRGGGTVTITPTTSTIDGAASVALGTNAGLRIMSDGTNYFTQRGTGSGGAAPLDATYWTGAANGTLSGEINLGALGTGLVINTAGTPSIYAGATCTNQVVRVLGAAGAATCVTLTSAYVDSSIITTAGIGTTYVSPAGAASWGDGVKQTFNPNDTTAGLNVGANAVVPATPAEGDIFYDSTDLAVKVYQDSAWVAIGAIQPEVDTTQTVFDRGKTITNANSFANARVVGDGTTDKAEYTDATYGIQSNCVVSAVENNCNYSRWLLTGKSFSFFANDRTTAIGTVTAGASSGAWTNTTLDVEATGNVITTTSKVNFAPVGCSGTTGFLNWDTNATLAPTATCVAGSTNTTLIQGYADFPDSDGEYQAQPQPFRLPADWTGALDLQLYWKAAATTGDVVWQVATLCRGDAEIEDAAWNAAQAFAADTAKGTTLQLNTVSLTTLTTTGCTAGDMFYMKIFRQRTHASDTIAGVVSLKHAELTIRRAQ